MHVYVINRMATKCINKNAVRITMIKLRKTHLFYDFDEFLPGFFGDIDPKKSKQMI